MNRFAQPWIRTISAATVLFMIVSPVRADDIRVAIFEGVKLDTQKFVGDAPVRVVEAPSRGLPVADMFDFLKEKLRNNSPFIAENSRHDVSITVIQNHIDPA